MIFNRILSVCKKANKRHLYQVLTKLFEETGELAQEVNIETGFLSKEKGADGIVGESVDIIIAAMDMIYLHNPNITEKELYAIIDKKCKKWESYLS